MPFVLPGEPWATAHEGFAPGSFSPPPVWTDFLQGASRLALDLLAGAVGIARPGA